MSNGVVGNLPDNPIFRFSEYISKYASFEGLKILLARF